MQLRKQLNPSRRAAVLQALYLSTLMGMSPADIDAGKPVLPEKKYKICLLPGCGAPHWITQKRINRYGMSGFTCNRCHGKLIPTGNKELR